jgi:hypothetical protein
MITNNGALFVSFKYSVKSKMNPLKGPKMIK